MKKQFVPFPEYLTALSFAIDGTRSGAFFAMLYDVTYRRECAFFVFDEDITGHTKGPEYFVTGHDGNGDYAPCLIVRTMHCKNCGQRMYVEDILLQNDEMPSWLPDDKVNYKCTCGMEYNNKTGWKTKDGE